ncbi:MAG TPA: hypothetical protein DEB30_04120 [Candidatus Peribacter riflensis]|nr:hypothetical protein [Candidatus Peribacter riflensis]
MLILLMQTKSGRNLRGDLDAAQQAPLHQIHCSAPDELAIGDEVRTDTDILFRLRIGLGAI